MSDKFSELVIEAFKEAGNVGAGHAAIALTKLFSRDVDMTIPYVRQGVVSKIVKENEIEDGTSIAFDFLDIENPIKYRLSVVFTLDSVKNILSLLSNVNTGSINSFEDLNEFQSSLMQEVGSNILLRYVAALNKMMKIDTMPKFASQFRYGVKEEVFEKLTQYESGQNLFLVQLGLFTDEKQFECQLYIQPHSSSSDSYENLFFS